jgi:hypothetical protein
VFATPSLSPSGSVLPDIDMDRRFESMNHGIARAAARQALVVILAGLLPACQRLYGCGEIGQGSLADVSGVVEPQSGWSRVVTSPLSSDARGTVRLEATLSWSDPDARLDLVSTTDTGCSGRIAIPPADGSGTTVPCQIAERSRAQGPGRLVLEMIVFSERLRTREVHVIGDGTRATPFRLEVVWSQTVDCD